MTRPASTETQAEWPASFASGRAARLTALDRWASAAAAEFRKDSRSPAHRLNCWTERWRIWGMARECPAVENLPAGADCRF